MSSSPTYPYEVVFSRPNKADPEATRKKFADGFAIQRQHPDLKGVVVEGLKVEDDTIAMRILEWTSAEGHLSFRASPLYAEFTKVREGAYVAPADMSHYEFSGSPLTPNPPVFECLFAILASGVSYADFAAKFTEISKTLLGAGGATGLTIGQQREQPNKVLILLHWNSVDHHLSFRSSEGFQPFIQGWTAQKQKQVTATEMYHVKTCEPGFGV